MRGAHRQTAIRIRVLRAVGWLSVCAYVGALTVIAIDHSVHGPALASSPGSVVDGRLAALLTSGLVVDGPALPQIVLLAAVLFAAFHLLGTVRLWTAALSAHVGATLLAYAGIGVAWMVDPTFVGPVTGAPDFGISVILTGELGALLAASRNRAAIPAGSVALALPGAVALALTGTVDPFVLASAEHSLGFWLGAAVMPDLVDESRTRRLSGRAMCPSRPLPRLSRVISPTGQKMINPRAHPHSTTETDPGSSELAIREYRPDDEQAVVALSLRAWAPVFASLEQALGDEIFLRVHGGWRYQATAVRQVLAAHAMHVWVAEAEREVVAFVAAKLNPDRLIGEISMLAVEPGHQRRGVGGALTEFATDWLRRAGMQTAMVETGGGWGHAAARGVCETAGYTPLPVARYFKAL